MAISFRVVRTAGLTLIIAVIVVMGGYTLSITERIAKTAYKNIELRNSEIKQLERVRDLFDRVFRNYAQYMMDKIQDIAIVETSLDKLYKESLTLRENIAEESRAGVESLIKNIESLRFILSFYANAAKANPAGADTLKAEEELKEAEILLYISIINLRKHIRKKQENLDNEMLNVTRRARQTTWVTIGGGIIIGLLVALFMGRALASPIRELVKGTKRLAAGDLDSRVEIKSRDEIGQLADAFNKMVDNLKKTTFSKDYVDNIIQSIIDALIVVSPDGTIETVNRATMGLLGYSEKELIGKNISQLFDWGGPADPLVQPVGFQELIKKEKMVNHETKLRAKDQKSIPVLLSGAVMKGVDKKISGVVMIAKDITERKEAENEKERLEAQIRQTQKLESVGTMANGIAHSFNNILGAIRGYADMSLKMISSKSRIHSYLQHMVKGTEEAKGLADKMLIFSRQESVNFKSVCIQSAVEEAVTLFMASMTIPATVERSIDASCGPVYADVSQIQQVVMNLCTNAYHSLGASNRTIKVGLKETAVSAKMSSRHKNLEKRKYVVLTVKDSGYGMDQQTMNQIFEPFFTTKKVGEGTGLGLSIIHGIVMSHNGEIVVESQLGKGTTFDVYFPLAHEGGKKAANS